MARPEPTQSARATGKSIASKAVAVKALDVQPPHLRYQPNMNARLTTQPTRSVTLIQSMRSGSGFGGRSGLMKRRTSGTANSASGTFTQKIHRHDNASFTTAVKS